MKAFLIPIATAVLALAAAHEPARYERISAGARASHNGRYTVSASPVDADSWIVQVNNRSGGVIDGARVYAFASMPENGRSAGVHVRATEAGRGTYRLDDVQLDRPGWWNIALVITSPIIGTDSAAFNVTIRQDAPVETEPGSRTARPDRSWRMAGSRTSD
jgi:hypothetical protein